MANIKSSQKKNRQRITHEAVNRSQRSAMRSALKRLRTAIDTKNGSEAKTLLAPAVKLVNRAGGKGLIKPRAASRTVSRLTVAVSAIAAK